MNCMSQSSKFMGVLIFSYMAFNHGKRNFSFVAFYYRFLVAIKMLLKLIDLNVPSPPPHSYRLALSLLSCGVIDRDEQGRVLVVEKGGVPGVVKNTNQNAPRPDGRVQSCSAPAHAPTASS